MSQPIDFSIQVKAYIPEQLVEIQKTTQYRQYQDIDTVSIPLNCISSLIEALQHAQIYIEDGSGIWRVEVTK